MTIGLFSSLSSYKPREDSFPEENFCTEILSSILKYSQQKQTPFFARFMYKLGSSITPAEYSEYNIITQKPLRTSTTRIAIPDLLIENAEMMFLIEIKIGAGLNYYPPGEMESDREALNQIKLYQAIETQKKKNIYLLTKNPSSLSFSDCPDFKEKMNWQDVYSIAKEYSFSDDAESFLLDEFKRYLEEKKMTIEKVGYDLKNGLTSVLNLLKQTEAALEGIPYEYNAGSQYLGFLIRLDKNDKKQAAWIGINFDNLELYFEIRNSNASKYIEQKCLKEYKKYWGQFINRFDFENHYFCLDAEKQLNKLKEWINKNYSDLKSYSQSQI